VPRCRIALKGVRVVVEGFVVRFWLYAADTRCIIATVLR